MSQQKKQDNPSNRREFLKELGMGVGATAGLLGLVGPLVPTDLQAALNHDGEDQSATRWGMLIDMSLCKEGCNDCQGACHKAHNVPDHGNPKDEIKWIWKAPYKNVFPSESQQYAQEGLLEKPFLTLCNHCAEPPCVRVCPTNATFKRKDGVVQMDFHRCIGCRFCMAGCPYGSRSFNWRDPRPNIKQLTASFPTRERGVVEKCNFCAERLDRGLGPVCAETCQEGVITFGNLHDPASALVQLLKTKRTMQRKPELGTQPSVFYVVAT